MTIKETQDKVRDMWSRTKMEANDFELLLFFMEECGEFAEALRKHVRGKNSDRKIDIEKEAGDVLFNFVALANKFNIDLSSGLDRSIRTIEERYCK